jgi:hypothetical protein
MSGAALWISVPLQRHQRREIEEARARRTVADVRVRLISGSPDRFVVQNVGEGTARDVTLEIVPPEGKISPLPRDSEDKLPISVLRTGDRVELIALISGDSGTRFTARWRWRDEGGGGQERDEEVSLQRG